MIHILAAVEEAEGIAALGIDPLAILAQAVTFLTLFWVVKKYALGKIVDTLQERHQKIDDGVRLGYKMEKEFANLQERVEKELHGARVNADNILDSAHQEAGGIIKSAEDKATAKVDQMIVDAHKKIESDIERARRELQKDVVSLVAEATEVVIGEKLDAKKDAQLIEQAIAEVSK
jgi:F-type H+-transporting ATPase subunit b